ncbi:MAG TPA: mannose-1-phosphate guanylyltransferase [Pirellulales bacterium]
MLHALVMAGGSGTRFWPVSREATPKQMLKLLGDRSLLQATLDRLGDLVPPERRLIATSAVLADAVREQLPELPSAAVLAEPCKRDTAPCIGLAALLIAQHDPQGTMLVLPADHVIRDAAAFQNAVRQAVALVENAPNRLVTFGIRPSYPAESFGYLERGAPLDMGPSAAAKNAPCSAYRVSRFREKPQADVARQYVDSGNFYWNSGIFVWRAATIVDALAQHQPEMMAHLRTIAAAFGTPKFTEIFARDFAAIRGISIDFAVMEHADDVVLIEAPFDWDDLGSWQALSRQRGQDPQGNTVVGRHLGLNTKGSIVYGGGPNDHLIVTVGVEDLIIVHTPDATLVANRRDEESLRQVVKELAQRGWNVHL